MCSIFHRNTAVNYIDRINNLEKSTKPIWGKMNSSQMLAHCSGAFEESTKKPKLFSRLKINFFARNIVIGKRPYPKNMKTSKAFIISKKCDFEIEKAKLIKGIERVQASGPNYFLNRKHSIFGKMTTQQWNTFFIKHLDHHLRQFGV